MCDSRLIQVRSCMKCPYLGACADGLHYTKMNTEGFSPKCNLKTIPGFLEEVYLDLPDKTVDKQLPYPYTYSYSVYKNSLGE